MKINSHIIKLTGKAELPKEVDIGQNYDVALSGSITHKTYADNDDGSCDAIYTFKPVKVEVLNPLGERIKAKDTRSKSQIFRAVLRKRWIDTGSPLTQEEFYEKIMNNLIHNADEIVAVYLER